MKSYRAKDILTGTVPVDTTVIVKGWVKTRRDSKAGLSFIHLSDGSHFNPLQIIAETSLPNYNSDILKLTSGCSIEAEGVVTASPGDAQSFEIRAARITVLGWIEDPDTYPISPKHHSLEYLREVPHLRVRTNTIGAVTRIRHITAKAIHDFFHQEHFIWLNTPIITTSDCEGAGELFRVTALPLTDLPRTQQGQIDYSKDFFNKETFLTVSGQLNAESYASALSRVYTFGPTFRAENSNTSRHLAEFWMVEPEVAFADLQAITELAENMLKFVFTAVLDQCQDDMAFFAKQYDPLCITRLEDIIKHEFERMDYSDAITILKNANQTFEYPVEWGLDLQSEHERYIAEKHVGKPVILMNYPKEIKGFYMRENEDGKTVAAMDVLVPGIGEIIGGSQREERFDKLNTRIEAMGDTAPYQWYLDLRRYGTVPHAGYGLGFERLISYMTALSNVRDVIPFPRTPGNALY